MAQLVEALRYKPTGRGFDSRWCHWNFCWHNPSGCTMALGVNPASNRNEYQEYFLKGKGGRCIRLTTLPPSCADCLEIWEPQPPGTLRASSGLESDCFTLTKPLKISIGTYLHFLPLATASRNIPSIDARLSHESPDGPHKITILPHTPLCVKFVNETFTA